jgi:hypothetical protein
MRRLLGPRSLRTCMRTSGTKRAVAAVAGVLRLWFVQRLREWLSWELWSFGDGGARESSGWTGVDLRIVYLYVDIVFVV